MAAWVRLSVVLLTCGVLAACSAAVDGTGGRGDDCVSRYDPVASGPTWAALQRAMRDYRERGRVVSLRTQARGDEADTGIGDQNVVRVVDLLGRGGRRLAQVHVWRSDGAWHAGAWSQCID